MNRFVHWILLPLLIVGAVVGILFEIAHHYERKGPPFVREQPHHTDYYTVTQNGKVYHFNLLDPELAPPEIKEEVMKGYQIFCDTRQTSAKQYIGNKLDCSSCHLSAGITFGGKSGGIPLVGVTAAYPRFSKRDNKSITLADRIDNCFKRSLNGKAAPHDSPEVKALITYLEYISSQVKELDEMPWLGIQTFDNSHKGDPVNGKELYFKCCADCHGKNGEGTQISGQLSIPPLFGPDSFNDGAGLTRPELFAGFIFANMPFGQPTLTEEQALDITAYVLEQPRPVFNPPKSLP